MLKTEDLKIPVKDAMKMKTVLCAGSPIITMQVLTGVVLTYKKEHNSSINYIALVLSFARAQSYMLSLKSCCIFLS